MSPIDSLTRDQLIENLMPDLRKLLGKPIRASGVGACAA